MSKALDELNNHNELNGTEIGNLSAESSDNSEGNNYENVNENKSN